MFLLIPSFLIFFFTQISEYLLSARQCACCWECKDKWNKVIAPQLYCVVRELDFVNRDLTLHLRDLRLLGQRERRRPSSMRGTRSYRILSSDQTRWKKRLPDKQSIKCYLLLSGLTKNDLGKCTCCFACWWLALFSLATGGHRKTEQWCSESLRSKEVVTPGLVSLLKTCGNVCVRACACLHVGKKVLAIRKGTQEQGGRFGPETYYFWAINTVRLDYY